ncbi:MAG: cysteine desulfurase-like protein [Candidatus Nanopelagicaceae bacterium]
MAFDVNRIRKEFPSLDSGIAFFDGPGGSQVPRSVAVAIANAITQPTSNRNTVTLSEQNAEASVQGYRSAVADLLNCDPRGVIYGRSWTQLTYDMSRNLAKDWQAGDEIIVTRIDHDSNIRPWVQAAQAKGVTVKWAEFDPESAELPTEAVTKLLSAKTKFVAVTGAANTLGTRPDIKSIAREVRRSGALFLVDAVHLTPHAVIDFKDIGADFLGFSSYKIFGPHCGTLVSHPELLEQIKNDKLAPSTSVVPERFEFGTLPYEIMAGVTASIDFVASMDEEAIGSRRERIVQSMNALEAYEHPLFEYLENEIRALPGVRTYGHAKLRTPTLYFTIEGKDSVAIYKHLATLKVNAPAHNFYAFEASHKLGLGDKGAIRAGLAPYSTKEDVDRLVAGLKSF